MKAFFAFRRMSSLILFLCLATSKAIRNIDSESEVFARCTRKTHCEILSSKVDPDPNVANETEILVFFNSYQNISQHVNSIYQVVGDCENWWNVARENPAASRFPTDFLVLGVSSSDDLLPKLSEHPSIRSFSKQRQIDSRNLFSMEDETDQVDPELETDSPIEAGDDSESLKKFNIMGVDEDSAAEEEHLSHTRHILANSLTSITKFTGADVLWKKGHTGQGIKVAVFDTGMRKGHQSFRNVKERTDWTDENTLDDQIGHGTFVAGLIAGTHSQCSGFAPDAEVYAFRVFNRKQASFTSWFLDAFNYAMQIGIDVLNLSIGGPDFLDKPFVEKVWEMSANGIIVVSAIGNDGPRYGTLNNPADQLDVIGVGGITYEDTVASFSSRGMTTWELPSGYGRVKPDIVAFGKGIRGSTIGGGCRSLSGTSVASPVVAGMVTLLAEIADKRLLNPAMMKQVLAHSATPVANSHIFEQGMGKVDLLEAAKLVENYIPHASTIPESLDLTRCPYMWPYCTQPAYYSSMPVQVNLTVLNPLSVSGTIEDPKLVLHADGYAGEKPLIEAKFTYSENLWPWSGFLALSISVTKAGISMTGVVSGRVVFTVVSDRGEKSIVTVPLRINLIPPPPREKRLLWDQFHSLRYPSGYFPRDNLAIKNDILDWNGDHIHTNFKGVYDHLRARGYFVETIGTDWSCVDSMKYGALILVDPEEAYFDTEIDKIVNDVYVRGLSLLVIAEWQNVGTMKKLKFLDQNTQSWWLPQTGGSNLPQLNRVLEPFQMALSDRILDGTIRIKDQVINYESGTSVYKFPKGGRLYSILAKDAVSGSKRYFPVMGIHRTGTDVGNGRVAIYGDSNCLDGNHRRGPQCNVILDALLEFLCNNRTDETIFPPSLELKSSYLSDFGDLPVEMQGVHFSRYSNVVGDGKAPQCLNEVSDLPNATSLIPPVNNSDFLPHLPAPQGGFHPNSQQGLPYLALGFILTACGVGMYLRFCGAIALNKSISWDRIKLTSAESRTQLQEAQSKSQVGSPDANGTHKWSRHGKLHKRTNGHNIAHDNA